MLNITAALPGVHVAGSDAHYDALMRQSRTTAGHEGSIVVQRVKEMHDEEGFNAQTEQRLRQRS